MEAVQFLKLWTFFEINTNNYFVLSNFAWSSPVFLFSESAHMFFILTQPKFIRGVVLPWVISFEKKKLTMPSREFHLKIHGGICCSQPHPGGQLGRLHAAPTAAQSTWLPLPSLEIRWWRFSQSLPTSPMTGDRAQGHPWHLWKLLRGCLQCPDTRIHIGKRQGHVASVLYPWRPLCFWAGLEPGAIRVGFSL